MNKRIFILLLCLFGVLATPHAYANKSGYECSAIALESLEIDELYYLDGGGYLPFSYKKRKRGEMFRVGQIVESFQLFKKEVVTKEGGEEEIVYNLVGKCPVPAGTKKLLFVLLNSPSTKLPIAVKALDDSLTSFPPSTLRFINLTGKDMYVHVSEKISKLPKGKFTTVKVKTDEKGGYTPMSYANSKGKEIKSTLLYFQERKRTMIVISNSQNERRPVNFAFIEQSFSPVYLAAQQEENAKNN